MDCNCINLAQIGVGAAIGLLSLLAGAALVWKVADSRSVGACVHPCGSSTRREEASDC